MRFTSLTVNTLRQNPTDADTVGRQLLRRGGFLQPMAAGTYSYLPLGQRVRKKLERLISEELEAVGGQEVSLPVVPPEVWRASDRRRTMDGEVVPTPADGEIVSELLRKQIHSYRQLPILLYQIQWKCHDASRPQGQIHQCVAQDAYSLHASATDLDDRYEQVVHTYSNIFHRVGLPVVTVETTAGVMGDSEAHQFVYPSPVGDDELVLCNGCGYRANSRAATFRKEAVVQEPRELEEVATPDTHTIAALADLLDIPTAATAKAAFFMSQDRFIFAMVRGDMEVNESKLARVVGTLELRPAQADEIAAAGIVAGYASPVGVHGVTVVVDDVVARSPNLVAGANRPGYHLRNTNFPRDYQADLVADIAAVPEGAPCPACAAPLRRARGMEVGETCKLGSRYSRHQGVTFLDDEGRGREAVMGSYRIDVGRLLVTLAEHHHDERGLVWPVTVAPFAVVLVALDLDDQDVRTTAEQMYRDLTERGIEVLYDDRKERAGVKFNDADLLGMPLRLTIGRRSVGRGIVEMKARADGQVHEIPLPEAVMDVERQLERMRVDVLSGAANQPPGWSHPC